MVLEYPLARDYWLREWLLAGPEWILRAVTWGIRALGRGMLGAPHRKDGSERWP